MEEEEGTGVQEFDVAKSASKGRPRMELERVWVLLIGDLAVMSDLRVRL